MPGSKRSLRLVTGMAALALVVGCGLTEPDCVVVIGPDVLIAPGEYELERPYTGAGLPLSPGADSVEVYVNPGSRQLRATYVVEGRRVTQVWRMENRRTEP